MVDALQLTHCHIRLRTDGGDVPEGVEQAAGLSIGSGSSHQQSEIQGDTQSPSVAKSRMLRPRGPRLQGT